VDSSIQARAVIAAFALCLSCGCSMPPAAPTPVPDDGTRPTLLVSPGTVDVTAGTGGRLNFLYRVCTRISNVAGKAAIAVDKLQLTPFGAAGSYPGNTIFTSGRVPEGHELSDCRNYQVFNATHPVATQYRLQLTYFMYDNPTVLTLEASSTLEPRFR
jgi:hypothetical protein